MRNILSQQRYLYLILGIVILVIYAVLLGFIFFGKSGKGTLQTSLPPTPIPTQMPQASHTKPAVLYEKKGSDRLSSLLQSRSAISSSLDARKKTFLAPLGGKSGILQKTAVFTLSYIQSANVFQAEITTIDIGSAKEQATAYMQSKGFSQNDICRLPVVFYLNAETARTLRGKDLKFNPLPEGC